MSVFARLKKAFAAFRQEPDSVPHAGEGALNTGGDTSAVISELARLFAADPKAVELTLALGNLFRSQGDIEHAVKLRESLLARGNLDPAYRGRVLLELARDYRGAGLLDRAEKTYKDAGASGIPPAEINAEMARLFADSGNFSQAAQMYAVLQNPLAEAHFLVKMAEETAASGNDSAAHKLVKKAAAVYPPSPEAWLALTSISLLGDNSELTRENLTRALELTLSSGRLLLLEGLFNLTKGVSGPDLPPASLHVLVQTLTDALAVRKPDLLQYYYGGMFLQKVGRLGEAEDWYTKALVIKPDFWATRLNLMDLAARKDPLPPMLAAHITFFAQKAPDIKRFLCTQCSLRREQIFYQCPRCHTWHSVDFRFALH